MDQGVNTGLGGSAGTRTKDMDNLQRAIMQTLHYGILTVPVDGDSSRAERPLPNEDPVNNTAMPQAWVRASMLVRLNSLVSGNSGVRPELVNRLLEFLVRDIVPFVPIRGSISASGDLSPLSYIVSALQGHPNIYVSIGDKQSKGRRVLNAKAALSECAIPPLDLGPKEGLAMVNGTSVSAGIGALALHDAHCLAVLSQILTGMSTEALRGFAESVDPFIASIRPHPGQIESANNIRRFLAGSRLLRDEDSLEDGSLPQDRYALRTASQWIGPQLENFVLAHKQIMVECNSTTDNPLIDSSGTGRVLNGGNFQAMAVTSAMEKIRLSVQALGRLSFSQCSELINPMLSNGLPPNLAASEPSASVGFKGLDIGNASLISELGYLANPVGTHVQVAEMSNQAVNSLALISARYTHTALDVLSQLSANHLFAVCQALDLRAMHIHFTQALEPVISEATTHSFRPLMDSDSELSSLQADLWRNLQVELTNTVSMESDARFTRFFENLQRIVLASPIVDGRPGADSSSTLSALKIWKSLCTSKSLDLFQTGRERYCAHPDATPFLSTTAARVYSYVRKDLDAPFIGTFKPWNRFDDGKAEAPRLIGESTTAIYKALRDGRLYGVVMECLGDSMRGDGGWVKASL